ncbi:hypothetical protein [Agarilytica rhodophyticola]|uniref:hypothetical protein n=1 Tax=Agarilytica rhodophyticola TaxID=1737490 RepID=UPI000B34A164|nr:hypothetical protein [Agarilytica rhodophyticola]
MTIKAKDLVSVIFLAVIAINVNAECPIPNSEPVFLGESDDVQQYVWDLNKAKGWLAEADKPVDGYIESYQNYVVANTDLDQRGLLERQQDIFLRFLGADYPGVANFQILLDGEAGRFEKASCLDQLLLSGQFQRVDYTLPTEFVAEIYKRGNRLRVYVAWRAEQSYIGPPVDLSSQERFELIDSNWTYLTHLHNHPFFFGNFDIAGTIIASGADLNAYNNFYSIYPLQSARITNGIDSAIYSQADVDYMQ